MWAVHPDGDAFAQRHYNCLLYKNVPGDETVTMVDMQVNVTKTVYQSSEGVQKSQNCNPVSDKSLQKVSKALVEKKSYELNFSAPFLDETKQPWYITYELWPCNSIRVHTASVLC